MQNILLYKLVIANFGAKSFIDS